MEAFITGLGSTVTDMTADVGAVAVAALGIFAVVYGIRLAIKTFKVVGK